MDISKDELLTLLHTRGYDIVIDDSSGSKVVTFTSRFSFPYTLSYSYSTAWNNEEIQRDVVYKLLAWTGLKVQYTLD